MLFLTPSGERFVTVEGCSAIPQRTTFLGVKRLVFFATSRCIPTLVPVSPAGGPAVKR